MIKALPEDKIVDWSNLKLNLAGMMKFVSRRVDNIVGEGGNAGRVLMDTHFLCLAHNNREAELPKLLLLHPLGRTFVIQG